MATYRVLVGLDYAGKRAEPGDIVSDLPNKSVGWLTAQGIIEKTDGPSQSDAPVTSPETAPTEPKTVDTIISREPKSPTKKKGDN